MFKSEETRFVCRKQVEQFQDDCVVPTVKFDGTIGFGYKMLEHATELEL